MTTTRDVRSAVHDGTGRPDHGEIAHGSGDIGRVTAWNPTDGGTR